MDETWPRLLMLSISHAGGQLLLQDFLNWRQTGFKPWERGAVGGIDHYHFRKIYSEYATPTEFRAQAQQIALSALSRLDNEPLRYERYNL